MKKETIYDILNWLGIIVLILLFIGGWAFVLKFIFNFIYKIVSHIYILLDKLIDKI